MTVGERIKEIRMKLGMSQVAFADKINVSKQTLYKYENNIITNIPSDKIEAAAKLGNVSPSYLMGWTSSKPATNEMTNLADTALKAASTTNKVQINQESRYENLVIKEMDKMNQKGKIKLLDTAREMVCNPLYNSDYEIEVRAAHARTDIERTPEDKAHDDALMENDEYWK